MDPRPDGIEKRSALPSSWLSRTQYAGQIRLSDTEGDRARCLEGDPARHQQTYAD
jgi:hypothetical protein